MTDEIRERLEHAPVVPLVHSDDPTTAVQIAEALLAGGLTVIEVVLRTEGALACLAAMQRQVSGALVGAGTVLNEAQAQAAADAGARFIVSPGLDERTVAAARARGLPVFPGIATATEAQRAVNLGLDAVKFFPAGSAGGTGMLKSLAPVFRTLRFMPTGGVSAANLAEYLTIPSVLACGGSWLTPAEAVLSGDYERITALAGEALAIAKAARDW